MTISWFEEYELSINLWNQKMNHNFNRSIILSVNELGSSVLKDKESFSNPTTGSPFKLSLLKSCLETKNKDYKHMDTTDRSLVFLCFYSYKISIML